MGYLIRTSQNQMIHEDELHELVVYHEGEKVF